MHSLVSSSSGRGSGAGSGSRSKLSYIMTWCCRYFLIDYNECSTPGKVEGSHYNNRLTLFYANMHGKYVGFP